jgi:NADH:ubiquinone oxidoreductase subunit 2 (subunit N)
MKTLAGYAVVGNCGYCIAGVYAESDAEMEKVIFCCMESFFLDPAVTSDTSGEVVP